MAALGYGKTPLDVLMRMRDHGVSSDYVKAMKDLGYEGLAPEDLVTLRDHGFTAERIKRVNDRAGSKLPVDALLAALRDGRADQEQDEGTAGLPHDRLAVTPPPPRNG